MSEEENLDKILFCLKIKDFIERYGIKATMQMITDALDDLGG